MAGRRHLRWRRAALPAGLAGAAALLAGCFGGGTTTVQQTVQGGGSPSGGSGGVAGLSTTMVPKGPTDVTENITQLVTKDYDQVQDIQIECPSDEPSPPNYPVSCTMHGIDTSTLSRRTQPDGKHRPVTGQLSILGVYPPTQTYAFQLNYVPNFTLKPGYKPSKPNPQPQPQQPKKK
jgi:hypothetical protein